MQTCPKCGATVANALECPRCGVVFAKMHLRDRPEPAEPAVPAVLAVAGDGPSAVQQAAGVERIARFVVLGLLAIWSVSLARAGITPNAGDSFLHMPDLVFHEAGHVIFGVFGRFAGVVGGSLCQCLVPLICAVAFLRQRNRFAAALCLWWVGQNLLDLAPYIADARALQVVLIGGHTGAEVEGHDWEYILTAMGWLHRDITLGLTAYRLGIVTMAGALVWGAMSAVAASGVKTPSGATI